MSNVHKLKITRYENRNSRVKGAVRGTTERPRLCIYRSLKHIEAQVIDDATGRTLAAASSRQKGVAETGGIKHGGNVKAAVVVGKAVAEKAKSAGVTKVAFDRNGYRYHGRIKALADAAREGGLQF